MEIIDYSSKTDAELVSLSLNGTNDSMDELFGRYRGGLLQLYIQRTQGNREDAEDLLQETCIKAYLNLHRYDPRYTFGQWIYTIARNIFIDHVRRHRTEMLCIDRNSDPNKEIISHNNLSIEDQLTQKQSQKRLDELLAQLPPQYIQLIELRFFKDYSYEEIAQELSLPMGTVKTQIHRARKLLCDLIHHCKEPLI